MVWSQCQGTQSQRHLLVSTTACIPPVSLFPFPLQPVGVAGPFPSVSNAILLVCFVGVFLFVCFFKNLDDIAGSGLG